VTEAAVLLWVSAAVLVLRVLVLRVLFRSDQTYSFA